VDHFFDLIDVALDELETHGLHKHELHVELVKLTVTGDAIKLKAAIVLVDLKEELKEADDTDFLVEVRDLLKNGGEASDVVGMGANGTLKLGDLTSTQGLKKLIQPLEVGADQDVEDLLVKL
jgi:hypothetical protein